ncbi:hypothetical protein BDP81DRAFT_177476 [Colletotrichum phormii]|uniref:Uncharacterized protein n=1 Tax=Colletotrichum phormii TaxID=359342 RepID=A0AAJ0EGL4_9PEZI|nr:uncharacterized protein BDP81DRAFT_177476 [Colletotrichum phormii]KAK1639457.1 hypothetical protein BDP81DRAFT_177476 [Colletotrichum phormii]
MTAGPILCVSPYAWVLSSVSPCSMLHARLVRPVCVRAPVLPLRRKCPSYGHCNSDGQAQHTRLSLLLSFLTVCSSLSAEVWPGFHCSPGLSEIPRRSVLPFPPPFPPKCFTTQMSKSHRPPSPLLNQLVSAPWLFYNHPIFLKHSSSQPSQPE